MRTLIAYLAGIATAYAALAIWHRLPALPDPDWSPADAYGQPIDRGYGVGA